MNQSAIIGATLLGGFILYLATKNRLVVYEEILLGRATGSTQASTSSTPVLNALARVGVQSGQTTAGVPTPMSPITALTTVLNPAAAAFNLLEAGASIFGF